MTASVQRSRALLLVSGGVLGAVVRWAVLALFPAGAGFPWSVFLVNVLGSGLLGFLVVQARTQPDRHHLFVDLAGIGFCGGLTTFSTFAVEVATFIRGDRAGLAITYASASLFAGVLAALGGGTLELRARGAER